MTQQFILQDTVYELSQAELNALPESLLAELAACGDGKSVVNSGWTAEDAGIFEVRGQAQSAQHCRLAER